MGSPNLYREVGENKCCFAVLGVHLQAKQCRMIRPLQQTSSSTLATLHKRQRSVR